MVNCRIVIFILFTFALACVQTKQNGRFVKKAGKIIGEEIAKRAALKIIHGAVSSMGFLQGPKIILDIYEVITGIDSTHDQQNMKLDEIIASTGKIEAQVTKLSQSIEDFRKEVMKQIATHEKYADLKSALDDFSAILDEIDILFRTYIKLTTKSITDSEKYNAFIRDVKEAGRKGLDTLLEKMHRILTTKNLLTGMNIPMYLANESDLSLRLMCQKKQSVQRLIFYFYELVGETELKVAIMKTYAYRELLESNSTMDALTTWVEDQKIRMETTLNITKSIAARAPRELWTCDPEKHQAGITYEHVGPIFQKFVLFKGDVINYPNHQKMLDLHKRYDPLLAGIAYLANRENIINRLCGSNTCSSIKREIPKYCYSYPSNAICWNDWGKKFSCTTVEGNIGTVVDCEPVAKVLRICSAESNDYRRYKTINTDDKIYGRNETCTTFEKIAESKNIGDHDCDYCLCTCVQENHPPVVPVRVSIRGVTSDVNENKVITGVRIALHNGVYQILIEQGTLLANGLIDRKSVAWKDPSDSSADTVLITWDHRTFLLDTLAPSEERVLTGIRFETRENSRIGLAIQTTSFNLTSGKLNSQYNPIWWKNTDPIVSRKKLQIKKYGIPTLYYNHKPDPHSNQFIELTTSDMEQDIGQTVVPFFDTQPVNSTYPTPLSGAGLIHKGHPDSAGFLALKVFTFDINLLTRNASLLYSISD